MEDLITLAKVVSKTKVKQIEIIGNSTSSNSLIQQLYNDLVEGKFQGEEEAADHYFPKTSNQKIYFSRLKRKLKNRLLNTLFFIDINQPSYLEHQRAYHFCLRQLLSVKALLGRGARQAAIPLARKGIKKAQKYEFTDIALAFAKLLRTHYGTIVGNKKSYKKYNTLVSKYLTLYIAELKAEEYYTELMINYVNSNSTKKEILGISEKFSSELKELLKDQESYQLYFVAYLVFVLRYQVTNDYRNILKVCKEALKYFERKEHIVSQTAIFHYLFRMTSAYIHLKDYEQGKKTAERCLNQVPEGVTNWYIALDYNILLNFHSRNYQKAYEVYQIGINHSSFSQQYKYISERWKIHEAFISYLIMKGLILLDRKSQPQKYRIKKFLNEVPTYSKDKRGNNITILILHVLFLLQQQKYGEIIDRVESLKTYSHRYLRQDDTFRSNCFIKMLLQLPAASFHKKGVIRKAKKYWDKLLSVPLEEANQSSELEFIPYETLWEFVLESLDDRFH